MLKHALRTSSFSASLSAALRDSYLPCRRSLHAHFRSTPRPPLGKPVYHRAPLRTLSTATRKKSTGIRITTLFYALLGVGAVSTAYGLYDFYLMFTTWPEEVRGDLRAGVKAKHQGDFALSERYLQRAFETALSLDRDKFQPLPYLKLTGIAILLGEVLEANNRPEPAYETYMKAFDLVESNRAELSGEERLREVALASKLGEMANVYNLGDNAEEGWLVWAVEEVLKLAESENKKGKAKEQSDEETRLVLAELDLPTWVTSTDIGAPIEALGEFYARTGKFEYALPLYLQAISLLVPPPNSGKIATADELCRGAQLMSNMSELFMRGSITPEKLHQAESWARQGLSVIEKTKENARRSGDVPLCEQALAVTLFNLASIREMSTDPKSAKELFQKSLEQSRKIGLQEGIVEARQALRRLDRVQRPTTAPSDTISPGS